MTKEVKKLSRTEVKEQLNNLVSEFQKIPKLKTRKPKKPKEKQLDSIQETIDYLRVCIKYQVFDLEATRREVIYLKKLLKDNGNKK